MSDRLDYYQSRNKRTEAARNSLYQEVRNVCKALSTSSVADYLSPYSENPECCLSLSFLSMIVESLETKQTVYLQRASLFNDLKGLAFGLVAQYEIAKNPKSIVIFSNSFFLQNLSHQKITVLPVGPLNGKADSNTIYILDCSEGSICDLSRCCASYSINIIYSSIEISNAMKELIKYKYDPELVTDIRLDARFEHPTCVLEDQLAIHKSLANTSGDAIVFADELAMPEIKLILNSKYGAVEIVDCHTLYLQMTTLNHTNSLNTLTDLSAQKQTNTKRKRKIFLSTSSVQIATLFNQCPRLFSRIMRVFDFMEERLVEVDLKMGHYVEKVGEVGDTEFKKRQLILGQVGVGIYYKKSDSKVLVDAELYREDLCIFIQNFGWAKIQKLVKGATKNSNLEISEILRNRLKQAEEYMLKKGILVAKQDSSSNHNNKYEVSADYQWMSQFYGLWINQILALKNQQLTTKQYAACLIIAAYLRTHNTQLLQQPGGLPGIQGDLGAIQLFLKKAGSFQEFIKREVGGFNRKKSSAAQLDLQDLINAPLDQLAQPGLSNRQSSQKRAISTSGSSEKLRLKFNHPFLTRWLHTFKTFERLYKHFTEGEQPHQKLIDETLQLGSDYATLEKRNIRSYRSYQNADFVSCAAKKSILGWMHPMPRAIRIYKVLEGEKAGIVSYVPVEIAEDTAFSVIEYHQITTSLVLQSVIRKFEEEHYCTIETNPEFQSILVRCRTEHREKVQAAFSEILESIKIMCKNQVETKKHGDLTLVFESGATIREIQKSTSQTKLIVLRNLPLDWTEMDIIDLLDGIAKAEYVKLKPNLEEKLLQDAFISLSNQQDIINVFTSCDGVFVEGRRLKVCKPEDIKNPFLKDIKAAVLKWYAYSCAGTGLIEYVDEKSAEQVIQAFPRQCRGRNGRIVELHNLEQWVDEEYLRQVYGDPSLIENVRLDKIAPLEKDITGLIIYHIQEATEKMDKNFVLGEIKVTDPIAGERQCEVTFEQPISEDQVFNYFNNKLGLLGKCRTYVQRKIEYTYILSPKTIEILEVEMRKEIDSNPSLRQAIRIEVQIVENEAYLTIFSSDLNLFLMMERRVEKFRDGVDIKEVKPDVTYLDELGIKGINYIEKKYDCEIRNIHNTNGLHSLKVYCREKHYNEIVETLKGLNDIVLTVDWKVSNKVIEHALEHSKTFDPFLQDGVSIVPHPDTSQLKIKGKLGAIRLIKSDLTAFCTKINKHIENLSEEVCNICFESYSSHPFKLTICGHRFCRDCLAEYVKICIDNSMIPISCPECGCVMSFKDIEEFMNTPDQLSKLKSRALKDYITKHFTEIGHCLTPNCEGVHWITKAKTVCSFCQKAYCMSCKKPFHAGLTCWENEVGAEQLFKRFLKANDVRKCPNSRCPAQIQKNGGCNKVLCEMCKRAICWKCMAHYPTPQECYDHLNKKHGGYFDN